MTLTTEDEKVLRRAAAIRALERVSTSMEAMGVVESIEVIGSKRTGPIGMEHKEKLGLPFPSYETFLVSDEIYDIVRIRTEAMLDDIVLRLREIADGKE